MVTTNPITTSSNRSTPQIAAAGINDQGTSVPPPTPMAGAKS
ncbi:hypothetical protein [Litchfieldia alkalitelluris]|nr:hypothetical protein [Litchfieldia alkalitelluris]